MFVLQPIELFPIPFIYVVSIIYDYTHLKLVRESVCDREVNGSHSTCAKVVHGCFPEGGDSFQCVYCSEPLLAKLLDNRVVSLASLLTKSHDQSRMCTCACERW